MHKSITGSKPKAGFIMPNFRLAIRQVCVVLVTLASLSNGWKVIEASKGDNHKLIMPTVLTVVDKSPRMEVESTHHHSSSHEVKMEPIIEMAALMGKAGAGKELLESRMDEGYDDLSALGGHKKYVLVKKKPKHKKIKMEVYKPKMKYKKIKIKVPVKMMKKKKVKGYMIKKEHDHYA